MPLIFVHGVTVRAGQDYDQEVRVRNKLFQQIALSGIAATSDSIDILNPYWGGHGAAFAWNHASLPPPQSEKFGPEDQRVALLLNTYLGDHMPAQSRTVLLEVAHHSLQDMVDLLWSVSVLQTKDEQDAAELATLALWANDYIRNNPQPLWLASLKDDQELLNKFLEEIDKWQQEHAKTTQEPQVERFGGLRWQTIKNGMSRLHAFFINKSSQVVVEATRHRLHKTFALFLGDILVYFDRRGTPDKPGPIVTTILQDLERARNRQQTHAEDNKLIIVAHSMGGNIIYDILTTFRPDIVIDVFVTVGSQVAFFEELKLYLASKKNFPLKPSDRVSKPQNIGYWLNVFDENDVLGFATQGVFDDTNDFAYPTGKGTIASHGSYFTLPSFHQRLNERLRALREIT